MDEYGNSTGLVFELGTERCIREDTTRMGDYKKDRNIQEGWKYTRMMGKKSRLGRYNKDRKIREPEY